VSYCDTQAISWFEVVELLVTTDAVIPMDTKMQKGTKTDNNTNLPYFDKSSAMIHTLVHKTWFSCYQLCQYIIYDNGSQFKLHFEVPCKSFGIKHKPTSVKNPQANATLKQVHQVITTMLHTAELDMANTVETSDIDRFLTDATWAICSTCHTVLKASAQEQQCLVGTCCLTYPSLLTGIKLENMGRTKLTSTQSGKFLML
jgi:hypothetical protein